MLLNPLNAITPIDGRYTNKTSELQSYFSEASLINFRVEVEIEYFISLCNIPLEQLNDFPKEKILLTSECGFGHVPIDIVRNKIKILVETAKKL